MSDQNPELKTPPPVMKRLTEEESDQLYNTINALIEQKGFTNWHVIMWEKDPDAEKYTIKGTVALGCIHDKDDMRVLNMMLLSVMQKIQQQCGLTEEEKAKRSGKPN